MLKNIKQNLLLRRNKEVIKYFSILVIIYILLLPVDFWIGVIGAITGTFATFMFIYFGFKLYKEREKLSKNSIKTFWRMVAIFLGFVFLWPEILSVSPLDLTVNMGLSFIFLLFLLFFWSYFFFYWLKEVNLSNKSFAISLFLFVQGVLFSLIALSVLLIF
ncbi:MAG TPA: hypothetical protein ENI61_01835 [Ignavibacteria bacterium]|nr:hypothetical protein [Ignavibacteria bacterium]